MAANMSLGGHEGLDVAGRQDAPEVVSGPASPDIAHNGHYYSPSLRGGELPPPIYQPGEKRISSSAPEAGNGASGRYCGLRRGVFIALLVVVLLVVILAAVLGGVLGTVLPKKHKVSSPPAPASTQPAPSQPTASLPLLQTDQKTGMAAVLSAADNMTLLTYYQDPQNRIIENVYRNGTWSLANSSNLEKSVVTVDAGAGSPLAALSYQLSGLTYRQVFFFSADNGIMSTNSTSTTSDGLDIATSWSDSVAITNDTAGSSIGLAACTDGKAGNGIHILYPSQSGYFQGSVFNFESSTWQAGSTYYDDFDIASGVACSMYSSGGEAGIYLYMRDLNSGRVQQVAVEIPNSTTSVVLNGIESPSEQPMTNGSDIAVCSDSLGNDYVFYQLPSGFITRAIIGPGDTKYEAYDPIQDGQAATKLAAAYLDGGALLMFQNGSNASTMYASDVSIEGVSLLNVGIP